MQPNAADSSLGGSNMQFFEKPEEEILKIAEPMWENLIEGSNERDYAKISKQFSKKMLANVDEVNMSHQWESSDILTSLSTRRELLGCLRRGRFVTVLWKQLSFKVQGDYLATLVLGVEDQEIKIFGATIN
jgi:hypothetical protein